MRVLQLTVYPFFNSHAAYHVGTGISATASDRKYKHTRYTVILNHHSNLNTAIAISSVSCICPNYNNSGSPPCDLPFFESGGECVETCLEFQFGNHLSGACEPCKFDPLQPNSVTFEHFINTA